MINSKKLNRIVRKWQRLAALHRKRSNWETNTSSDNMSPVAEKGHFLVYTADQRRFMLPMSYLSNQIIRQLLAMAEDEFGLRGDGPITLPCDAALMEYVVSLIRRRVDKEMEKALLTSIASTSKCSLPYHSNREQHNQKLLACSC